MCLCTGVFEYFSITAGKGPYAYANIFADLRFAFGLVSQR